MIFGVLLDNNLGPLGIWKVKLCLPDSATGGERTDGEKWPG